MREYVRFHLLSQQVGFAAAYEQVYGPMPGTVEDLVRDTKGLALRDAANAMRCRFGKGSKDTVSRIRSR